MSISKIVYYRTAKVKNGIAEIGDKVRTRVVDPDVEPSSIDWDAVHAGTAEAPMVTIEGFVSQTSRLSGRRDRTYVEIVDAQGTYLADVPAIHVEIVEKKEGNRK